MVYTIFHNGTEINRIEGAAAFVDAYCTRNGYTYKETPFPVPGPNLEEVRAEKISAMSAACNAAITAGIDVTFDEETTEHFKLTNEDQANINSLFKVVELGGTEYLYQADPGKCRTYSAAEITKLYTAMQTHITTQLTYYNTLKDYITSMDTLEELETVTYGMELPEAYQAEMEAKLEIARQQMEAIVANLAARGGTA